MGEVAAAWAVGALSLEDAVRVVCARSRLMREARGKGAMALVELSLEEAEAAIARFGGRLCVAVNNSRRSTVVAGDPGALEEFLAERFDQFGPYEDAISTQHAFVFHSVMTPGLNIGLLSPQHVLERALEVGERRGVALASLEGFVRQLIGWREYMRATYQLQGRRMRTRNHPSLSEAVHDAAMAVTKRAIHKAN